MTLGGLALAIGPLVDDAIVELENNHRNYSLGKSRIRAALDGCAEVMVPVLVATCTTNIVLAPLALMPGMGGFLFRPLALAVTFAMFTSFLLSRTFVPMMCAKFLPDEHRSQSRRPHGTGTRQHARRQAHELFRPRPSPHRSASSTTADRYLRGCCEWRSGTASWCWRVVGLLFLGSLGLGLCIGREFFPQVDAGQITMYLRCPSNLRLDAAETARRRGRGLHQEQHPRRRARDDRHRNGRRSRLVGGLHRQLRPAGRRHPHPAERRTHAQRPGICHQAAATPFAADPPTSPTCASASTPAAWSPPP